MEYLQKKGRLEAFSLANRFITMISTVTLLMMLLGMAFAKPLTLLIAPGYDVETVTLCVGLLRMLFPTMLFTAVAFSFVGILQSLEEFNVPAALSVVSNGGVSDWLCEAGGNPDSAPLEKGLSLSPGFSF